MINVNTLKPGITFSFKNELYVVLDSHHSKQGRGQANVKTKVKNLKTGTIKVITFAGGSKVVLAHIEKQEMSFLYATDSTIVLMDQTSFEQFEIAKSKVEWESNFLIEGSLVKARFFENQLLDIELPPKVEMKVISAPDAVRGNTQSNPQKQVKIATGYELDAPMFIKVNDMIIINTSDGKYWGKGGK